MSSNPVNKQIAAIGEKVAWHPSAIEMICISALNVAHAVLRKHSRRQIKLLAQLIKRYGFVVPILVDQDNNVVAGVARVAAAQLIGMTHVPAIRLKHLTEPEIRALRIADNRLGELSAWDKDTLAREIIELQDLHIQPLDLGFATGEIDFLVEKHDAKIGGRELNDIPAVDRTRPAVSKLGDIWKCGPHRLACGDTRDGELVCALLGDARIRMVCTDVPFNVRIKGNVSGLGKIKHDDFAMASGEMTDEEFNEFLAVSLSAALQFCVAGALVYVFIDAAHLENVYAAGRKIGLEKFSHCVWAKTNAGMGAFYRSQTEHIVIFKVPGGTHINNIELGRYGRTRSNLWRYEGANSINPARRKELALHPTVKNAEMIADAIKDCTNAGDIVFDGFIGSGTAIVAAEDASRVCYGVELDPYYVDVVLRRYREFTGEEPVHAVTGLAFAEAERLSKSEEGRPE